LDFIYLITYVTPGVLWDALYRYDYDAVILVISDAVVAFDSRYAIEGDRLFLGHPPR